MSIKTRLAVRAIDAGEGRALLAARHPAGDHKRVSIAHGVYWDGEVCGALGWGWPANDLPAKHLGGTRATVPELLRMWLSDAPERNSESMALAESVRLLRAAHPAIVGVVTYCNSTDPAYGYRAAGWLKGPTHADGAGKYTRYSLAFAPPKRRAKKPSAAEAELAALTADARPPVAVRAFAHADPAVWPLIGPLVASRPVAVELGGAAFGDERTTWFVADLGGRVVGMCALRADGRGGYWFENDYVLPAERGRGVFAALAAARDAHLATLPPGSVWVRVRLPRWRHFESRGFARGRGGNTNWVVGVRPAPEAK